MQRVQKKKPNHIDGKLLLKLLRGNRFPKIWIPYPENGYLRQLLWHRQLSASTDADTVIRQLGKTLAPYFNSVLVNILMTGELIVTPYRFAPLPTSPITTSTRH